MKAIRWGFPVVLACVGLPACATEAPPATQGADVVGATAPVPFCARDRADVSASTGMTRTQYWGRGEVQQGIRHVLKSPAFGCTPHSAYLVAYAAMTKARDEARCADGDAMKPKTLLDTRLNDALADMMTRNYVQIVEGCRTRESKTVSSGADVNGAFCAMHKRAEDENWTALRVAMGGTAHYLSTHIALALSALPHIDDLWVGTGVDTLEARIEKVREYRDVYQSFNSFLGQKLTTVAGSLETSGLTAPSFGSHVFQIGAEVTQSLSLATGVFGNRRDVAFDAALRLAALLPPGTHPWTVKGPDGRMHMRASVADAPAFPRDTALEQELEGLAREGDRFEAALSNPLMQLFGSHTFRSLEDPESKRACEAKLALY